MYFKHMPVKNNVYYFINLNKFQIKNINNNNSTDESLDGDDICLLKEGQGFYPVKGQSGLFYKVLIIYLNNKI